MEDNTLQVVIEHFKVLHYFYESVELSINCCYKYNEVRGDHI